LAAPRLPVGEPCAWRAAELDADPQWRIRLSRAQAGEVASAVAELRRRGARAAEFAREDFPLPTLAPLLARVSHDLEHGRGCVLLSGLPVAPGEPEDAARVLWGIGAYLGRALRQHARVNLGGYRDDLVGTIVDQGLDYNAPNVFGSATGAEQMPHTDPADVVGLLCVRPAASGGVSRIASAMAVYNELRARRPELLDILFEGFHHDLRGQEAGATATTPRRMPVFSRCEGRLACIFNSKTVLAAQQKTGIALTPLEREALDAVVALALDPAFQVEMNLQPGDLQLLNNYTILHSRTAWTDADPARRRTMLRLWLKVPEARPLAPDIAGGYSAGAHYDIAQQAAAR